MTKSHNSYDQCPECVGKKDTRAKLCSGCRARHYLPKEAVAFVRDNIDRLSWRQMSVTLCVNQSTVRGLAWRNGIEKSNDARREAIKRGRWGLTADERYEKYVVRSDGCWGWTGMTDAHGYGTFGHGGKHIRAHRFSYERTNGPIPKGMNACHRCDNPACSNPEHIFIGTQGDNMRDAATKGRVERGSRHHAAKLTESNVQEIRRLRALGVLAKDIAPAFGIAEGTAQGIIARRHWRHVL